MDETYCTLLEAVQRVARDVGLSLSIDGIEDRTAGGRTIQGATSLFRENQWDRMYSIRIPALPGGPAHMALAAVTTAAGANRGAVELMQVRRMMVEQVSRLARIDEIHAAGLDPHMPPAWSLETYAATLAVMRALDAGTDMLRDFVPINGGGLEAIVPGLGDCEARVSIRDSILEWSTAIEMGREWSYRHSQRELRILGRNLPETACHAIRTSRMRVCDIVDDEILGRLETIVEQVRNETDCIVLTLASGWEWLAPLPPGMSGEWRIP